MVEQSPAQICDLNRIGLQAPADELRDYPVAVAAGEFCEQCLGQQGNHSMHGGPGRDLEQDLVEALKGEPPKDWLPHLARLESVDLGDRQD